VGGAGRFSGLPEQINPDSEESPFRLL